MDIDLRKLIQIYEEALEKIVATEAIGPRLYGPDDDFLYIKRIARNALLTAKELVDQ